MNTFLTSLGLISITQAQADDIDQILAILTGAGEWLTARGIDQWGPGQFSRNRGAAAIERREVYVARLGNEIIGTLRLQWQDEDLWDTWPNAAGYVHALAVKRSFAGNKIGCGLLQWAECQVIKADRKFLRLDCMAANPALRSYYQKIGFKFVGEAQKHGWNAALFEREVKFYEEAAR